MSVSMLVPHNIYLFRFVVRFEIGNMGVSNLSFSFNILFAFLNSLNFDINFGIYLLISTEKLFFSFSSFSVPRLQHIDVPRGWG